MAIESKSIYAVREVQGSGAPRFSPVIGQKEPAAHPSNCKHECPYGKDRAFCFPCYAKIMSEHRAARKAATEGV